MTHPAQEAQNGLGKLQKALEVEGAARERGSVRTAFHHMPAGENTRFPGVEKYGAGNLTVEQLSLTVESFRKTSPRTAQPGPLRGGTHAKKIFLRKHTESAGCVGWRRS